MIIIVIENIVPVIIAMFFLFLVANIFILHSSFKDLKNEQEDLLAIMRFKKKWSLILFVDFFLFLAIYLVILLTTFSSDHANYISIIITVVYISSVEINIRKSKGKVFGSNNANNENIRKAFIEPDHVQSITNDIKDINAEPFDQKNGSYTETSEMGKKQ